MKKSISRVANASGLKIKAAATTTPCCSKVGLKRGPWTPEEDEILSNYVKKEGEGRWRTMPKKAGLLRCGKSCRLRWMNYLRPSVKRGRIAPDEEDLILRLHRLLGNRWSLIAGRIPGRTDNEIKNYWNTHLSKKLISQGIDPRNHKPLNPKPSSSNHQNNAPKSAHYPQETYVLPYRVTATKLTQNFNLMPNQLENIDGCRLQIPVLDDGIGNWPSCDGLVMASSGQEQSNAAFYTENGNEDHVFSSFLDSLINDNEYLSTNQQLHLQHLQLQPLNATEPAPLEPFIDVSAVQNFNSAAAAIWEAGLLSSAISGLGDKEVALD